MAFYSKTFTRVKPGTAASIDIKNQEQKQSYACLSKNGYDHSKCEQYFDNYNTCKKFWGKVASERRLKGIKPVMPDLEERAQIREQLRKSREQQ